MIKTIGLQRIRMVIDVVLVAQFIRDVLKRLVQIFHLERKKSLSAGFFRQILQYQIALSSRSRGVGGNGVDNSVRLLRHLQRLIARVAALRVVAIRYQNHGAADIFRAADPP